MKILKRILLGIAGVIVLLLIIALFVKKEYTLERKVIINKPQQEVYDFVRMFKNQDATNPWLKLDPATKTEIRGNDGEVGAVYAWQSEKVGHGEQRLAAVSSPHELHYELHFIKPFEGYGQTDFYFGEAAPGQTKVRNTFSGKMPYPMNLMLLCVDMDKNIGSQLQIGLDNTKAALEK